MLDDPVLLARMQFAFTALFHFIFVPISIGVGLVCAIMQTRAYRTPSDERTAAARFWVRLYTLTFAIGVATGITMEFQFGTNWADYSRFVGDIFGSPLAAEALFAFFLESVFIGILVFGRTKVSRKLYLVSAWLAWAGSCLSALWIIIANSWMQTPAGYKVVGGAADAKAELTDFFAAAFNPSMLQRYFHTVVALLILGAFVCIAVGAYFLLKNRTPQVAKSFISVGVVMGIVCTVVMLPAAHAQAFIVAKTQPSKLAAMEGQYERGPVALSLMGWVDEANEQTHALAIPGGTSFLADGNFQAEYPGLNDFSKDERPDAVNVIFQSYHFMVALFGAIILVLVLGVLVVKGKLAKHRWPLWILGIGWLAPLAAIECGWMTAEFGRQPWIVFGELKVADAASQAVPPVQVALTIALFVAVYALIFVCWVRLVRSTLKRGVEPYLPATAAEGAGAAHAEAAPCAAAPSYFGAEAQGDGAATAHAEAPATGKEASR